MSEQVVQKRPNKKLIVLISLVGVLLVAVIVVLVMLLLRKPEPEALPTATPGTGNVVVDDGFDPQAVLDAASEMFNVSMSNPWEFPDGASPASDAYIANSTDNSLPFYFEVVLPGSDGAEDEVLYTSPVVPVGSAVQEITLSRNLDAGSYSVDVRYHLLNSDNTVKSTIILGVQLNVAA